MLFTLALTRLKVLGKRLFERLGVPQEAGLILLAGLIGLLTSVASISFHELIEFLRDTLYVRHGPSLYHGRMGLLILIPAAGGLIVGLIARYLIRGGSGHGVVDVIESVLRTRGFVKPIAAVEKILTSAITIGTGGSCGAEGPIIQIGAAISSFVGQCLSVRRHRMPLLVGCGCAAGISSIFHCPMGGVMFTLEVILRDFSATTLVPVVVASIVANVATYAIFRHLGTGDYAAIFAVPQELLRPNFTTTAGSALLFVVLGLLCGAVGVGLTRAMLLGERLFHPLKKIGPFRPAVGGAMVGVLGIVWVLVFGRLLEHTDKPLPFEVYPMPAFFADGYGVVRSLLDGTLSHMVGTGGVLLVLLVALLLIKIVATALTLSSGGSGGIIAPALFLGATSGAILGVVSPHLGGNAGQAPALAIIGMGACLAAVVHAPLASILMLFELTLTPGVIVPAMLATVAAHGLARTLMPDSIYTVSLRQRGLSPEAAGDMSALRKYTLDHLKLEPIVPLFTHEPASRVIDLATENDRNNFAAVDAKGMYRGMVTGHEIRLMLLEHDAIPLMTIGEVMRTDVTPVRHTENLQSVFDLFLKYDIDAMPVGLDYDSSRIIGIVTRDSLLRHYRQIWATRGTT